MVTLARTFVIACHHDDSLEFQALRQIPSRRLKLERDLSGPSHLGSRPVEPPLLPQTLRGRVPPLT
jgi:hypothetical protein